MPFIAAKCCHLQLLWLKALPHAGPPALLLREAKSARSHIKGLHGSKGFAHSEAQQADVLSHARQNQGDGYGAGQRAGGLCPCTLAARHACMHFNEPADRQKASFSRKALHSRLLLPKEGGLLSVRPAVRTRHMFEQPTTSSIGPWKKDSQVSSL